MTPLKQENLELKLENNIAYMTLSGLNSKETVNEGLEWFKQASEANDNFNICIEMAEDDFDDLSEMGEAFKRIGNVLRMNPHVNKCAVLTNNRWVKNSAKVESAVLPGMQVQPFDRDQAATANNWLSDKPIVPETPKAEAEEAEEETESDNPWDNLNVKKVAI